MSSFHGRLREEYSVVCNDSNWISVKMSKSSDERWSIVLFEFMESACIKDTTEHCIHIEWLLVVHWDYTIQVLHWVKWSRWLDAIPCVCLIDAI